MMAAVLDPVIQGVLLTGACIVLLTAAWSKWRDVEGFEISIADYRLLPDALLKPFARAYLQLETLAGLGLLIPATVGIAAATAELLLVLATAAIAINLLRGRTDIDCGCGGPHTYLSWSLVLRNLLLMAALAMAWFEPAPRALQWLDIVTVLAGAAGLFGLYAAANQLLSNHPQLAALRK